MDQATTQDVSTELRQALWAEKIIQVRNVHGEQWELGGVGLAWTCQHPMARESITEVLAVVREDFGPHRHGRLQCRTCDTQPATVCLLCARDGRGDCGHLGREAMYCDHCAYIYPRVAVCVDEFEPEFMQSQEDQGQPRGLGAGDYSEMWAGASLDGAPVDELRLVAGYLHGWTTQSGKAWPLPEVYED